MAAIRTLDEFGLTHAERRREGSPLVIFAVCMLLFVDTPLPVVGSSNRLIAVLLFALLVTVRSDRPVSTPFCAAMAFLVPLYFLVPPLVHPDLDAHDFVAVFVLQMASVAGMILLARAMSGEGQRLQLIDMLIVFALISAAVAILQRYGVVAPLGVDRGYGFATTESHELRGLGLMADPNFLAVMLAGVVPLAVNWRFSHFRWPAIVILALGVYATDSRTGFLLAVLALLLSTARRLSSRRLRARTRGRTAVATVAICLVALFAFNVGGQRDRVVEGVLIGVGARDVMEGHAGQDSELSARDRRELLWAWLDVGVDRLPFGVGLAAQDEVVTNAKTARGAHNTYLHALGQGGIAGILIGLTMLLCLACFIRRRSEPFAMMGIVVVAGSLLLSYPGTVFLLLPMGLADGIRGARLGSITGSTGTTNSHPILSIGASP